MNDEEIPECRPDQVQVSVQWREQDGALTGQVEVHNTGQAACRLPGKPGLVPLAEDGTPVGAQTVITLELRLPGYVVLEPGHRARARVSWPAWSGRTPAHRALVSWSDAQQQVIVSGPSAPTRVEGPTNISSSWFDLVPE